MRRFEKVCKISTVGRRFEKYLEVISYAFDDDIFIISQKKNEFYTQARQALGLDQAQFCISAAAPIMRSTLEYFASIGITINEIYGMSESSGPTTTNTPTTGRWGTIGFAPLGLEIGVFDTMDLKNKGLVKVGPAKDVYHPTEKEQGELCFRGRNIMMGYMANPDLGEEHVKEMEKKTKETFFDGWLMSGDKAAVDKFGMRNSDSFFKPTGANQE